MVCIRNDLKVHTQQLKLGSNDKYKEPVHLQIGDARSALKIGDARSALKGESEVEDGEFAITLRKEELLNRDNCMWLSISDASSPSSCYKDDGLCGYMDVKIDAWFISLLSTQPSRSGALLNTKITFFDGSRVNPIEEASLVLDQSKKLDENMFFQENLEEEEVVMWLKNESSDVGSECFSQYLDKRSKSKSMSMSKSKFGYYTDISDEQSLFSSCSSSDYSSEVMDLEEVSTDKPLFWPLNLSSNWGSETKLDYFIMSPRKDVYKVGISPKTTCNRELNSKQGCNRRLVYGTRLKSSDNMRNKDGMSLKKGFNRRLQFSIDTKSLSNMTGSADIVAMGQAQVDCLTKRSVSNHKMVLDDLLLVDKLNAEGVIEQVLGLDEFDGHEDIEPEFDKDEFSPWF